MDTHQSGCALVAGLAFSGLTIDDLALRCAGLEADILPVELAALLGGEMPRSERDHDILARALNEHLAATGVNYSVEDSRHLRFVADSRQYRP